MPSLNIGRYGKDNVRVYKVERHSDGTQSVAEFTVSVLLEGDISTSYTGADNSVVVPTDTMKQTCYIVAKQNPVLPAELYASTLAQHFIDRYSHIHVATVKVIQHRWTRMMIDGNPHPHSFLRDGSDTRNAEVVARRSPASIEVRSAIAGLLVLKSTGSAFHGFHKDEYTILKETHDRILSTEVDAGWRWKTFKSLDEVKQTADKKEFDRAYQKAREVTLSTFAKDESPSVQNTMYKMCEQILAAEEGVQWVEYQLPNKHYFEVDLSWHKGLKNTGKDAEVYAPQTDPNGLIQCQVGRS